jgi:hypothetical protein
LYVHLTIKPEHATLGGKTLEFDLLRYVPLEEWILEMERIAFPDDSADSAGQEAAPVDQKPRPDAVKGLSCKRFAGVHEE